VAFFFSFLIAMFVTMVLIPPLMRSAERFQFVDLPGERKVHTRAVPRIGGVAMVAGAVLPILMMLSPRQDALALLLGMGVILAFGVWDDRKNLDYRLKFFGQLIAALVVVLYGGVVIERVPFGSIEPIAYELAIPLTVFVLLAVTNAINLADGLDGLAGGTTLLSLSAIALLGYLYGDLMVALIALAVIGSILGFLRFNTYPARVFMGDGGSQFLGFSLGVLAVMMTHAQFGALSAALPALLLGLPILDTAMVMAQRVCAGRSPFSPDKNHIHHKLLALGLDHYEAVFVIYAVQAALVTAAYFLRYQGDAVVVGAYLAFCLSVVALFRWAHVSGWRLRAPAPGLSRSYVSRKLKFLRQEGGLTRAATYLAAVALPGYLLLGSLAIERIPTDIGTLALVILALLLALLPRQRGKPFNGFERGGIYILSTLIVYLIQTAPGKLAGYEAASNIFYVLLAIVVVIGFRFSQNKIFKMTPLDFLVIFIAFTVPNLPGVQQPGGGIGEVVAKIIVLFYAVELVLTNLGRGHDALRAAQYLCLVMLALRGLM
jgi:UDP-GlcNAc:undecaprenyl-phosphate GlcNAc-1-phosphate transferase